MKKNKVILLITAVISLAIIAGYFTYDNGAGLFKGLNLFIFILIILLAALAFYNSFKKDKEEKEGIPNEDELSTKIKYKSGYYAYHTSMYMWLFIFILKDKFPDIETMLGGGILLSALISVIAKYYIKQNFNG